MTFPKMSKTKMVGIAAIIGWPIAFLLGYRSGMVHVIAGAAVFMWWFQVLGAEPEKQKKKRNLGFRPQ